jgi:hypothetical protein
MFKGLSKVLCLTSILLAFIGQSIAYSNYVICEAPSETHKDEIPLLSGDTQQAQDCCDLECCAINCVCFGNTCPPFAYLQIDVTETSIVIINEAFYLQKIEQKLSMSKLLYRPPIYIA